MFVSVSLDTIVEEIRELAIYILEMAKENESRQVYLRHYKENNQSILIVIRAYKILNL